MFLYPKNEAVFKSMLKNLHILAYIAFCTENVENRVYCNRKMLHVVFDL